MAPYKDHSSKVLDTGIDNLKIVVRQFTPSTNQDFITTDGTSARREIAGFVGASAAPLAVSAFYVGVGAKVNMTLGGDVYVTNSAGKLVTLVHLK